MLTGLYQDELSSYCDSKPWNPNGDGLLFEDLDFPVFFINENRVNESSVLLDDVSSISFNCSSNFDY